MWGYLARGLFAAGKFVAMNGKTILSYVGFASLFDSATDDNGEPAPNNGAIQGVGLITILLIGLVAFLGFKLYRKK